MSRLFDLMIDSSFSIAPGIIDDFWAVVVVSYVISS